MKPSQADLKGWKIAHRFRVSAHERKSAFPRRFAPELCIIFFVPSDKGAGKAGYTV
jgi:hypothetical protein